MSKALIIDNKDLEREIINKFLNKIGFGEVIVSNNGKDGVKKAREEDPDLIIIDEMLSDISGFEACREIKENKEFHIPKIIVITDFIDAKSAEKAVNLGVDDLCVKTSDYAILLEAVGKIAREASRNCKAQNRVANMLK